MTRLTLLIASAMLVGCAVHADEPKLPEEAQLALEELGTFATRTLSEAHQKVSEKERGVIEVLKKQMARATNAGDFRTAMRIGQIILQLQGAKVDESPLWKISESDAETDPTAARHKALQSLVRFRGNATKESLAKLATEAARNGDTVSLILLNQGIQQLLDRIDYKNAHKKSVAIRDQIEEVMSVFSEEIVAGNSRAFECAVNALSKSALKSFAVDELVHAAAKGDQPSLDVLLNYDDYSILRSTLVGSCRGFGKAMPQSIIEFLVQTHRQSKALTHMSAKALQIAAEAGNQQAYIALKSLANTGEHYAVKYLDQVKPKTP